MLGHQCLSSDAVVTSCHGRGSSSNLKHLVLCLFVGVEFLIALVAAVPLSGHRRLFVLLFSCLNYVQYSTVGGLVRLQHIS